MPFPSSTLYPGTLVFPAVAAFDVAPATPSFPAAFLNVQTEIQINGTWTDISSYVYQGSMSIGRGHPDESTSASPSTFTASLNNSDGRFSQLSPSGPYYPYLGLNTPIRVSVPEGASYLRLENDTVSYCQGPTSTAFNAGFDIQVDLTPDNWFAPQILAGQYVSTGNQRSWVFGVNSGFLFVGVSSNGSTTGYCYAPLAFSADGVGGNVQCNPHQRMSVRAVYNASGNSVNFYTGSYCGSWVLLASVIFNGGTPFASTAPIQVGYCPNSDVQPTVLAGDTEAYTGVLGKVHAAIVQTLVGSVVADPDFTQLTPGVGSFVDSTGNTWSVMGTAEVSARRYRYHGYVSAWPQSWKPGGANALVTLSAGGKLRQMGQSQASVNSPMFRAYNRGVGTSSNLAAYWSMEDLVNATSIASGAGGAPLLFTGKPVFASNSNFACSNALPVINGAIVVGHVSTPNATVANSVRWLMQVPATGDGNGANMITVATAGQVSGIPLSVTVQYVTATNGSLQFYVGPLSALIYVSPYITGVNGQLLAMQIDVVQSGGNVNVTLSVLQVGSSTPQTMSSGVMSGTLGPTQQIIINPQGNATGGQPGLTGTAFGHLAVYTQANPVTNIVGALESWVGEPAGLRFQRLCSEESIGFRGQGNMADTVLMGTQTQETVAALLQECADADRGMWVEPRQCFGYGYRNRVSIGNQVPWVTFDYNQDHLCGDLLPTHDDQVIKNDVTVTNQGDGSSAGWTLNDGSPLSIGVVGRYDTTLTANLANDNQLIDEAGWIGHSLTVNEPRYTAINVDLANETPSFAALYYLVLDADIGDRVTVLNPPVWLPPGAIDQIIQGCNEVLSPKDLTEAWNGVPSTPYNVMYLDDAVYGRGDSDGSTLAVAELTGVATSIQVATTNSASPLWTTNAADLPLNIVMGGEVITVATITGASSPQVFSGLTRSVNGVVKPQVAGTDVRLAVQPTLSL